MLKKAFWVPYEDSTNYPTLAKTIEAISKYCEENGETCTFIHDDEVENSEKRYEIYGGKYNEESEKLYACGRLLHPDNRIETSGR